MLLKILIFGLLIAFAVAAFWVTDFAIKHRHELREANGKRGDY